MSLSGITGNDEVDILAKSNSSRGTLTHPHLFFSDAFHKPSLAECLGMRVNSEDVYIL